MGINKLEMKEIKNVVTFKYRPRRVCAAAIARKKFLISLPSVFSLPIKLSPLDNWVRS